MSLAAAEIPSDLLAGHPANPREDPGDLAELEASIREPGVLEPLVVVAVAAHLAGGWPPVAEPATHVVLAGHRRRAAAAALPREADWTPQLRDAFARLDANGAGA